MEKCALYCRLSREDEVLHSENGLRESESIQNQRAMLRRYADEHGWTILEEFIDEDYSGADSGRPAFCKLIQMAENRDFSIILCKSQSRFTRDLELVERYLHGLFPKWGVRFIAILDNADTNSYEGRKARQINGLINQWYLEDLSNNIKSVLLEKRKQGQYLGAFPLYGYQKDPNHHNSLIIDPEASKTVREIFFLYKSGMGVQSIANALNKQSIPNPTAYKQQLEDGIQVFKRLNSGVWSRSTVSRILDNEMYAGHMIQGRYQKLSYKERQIVKVPEEKWVKVENTHPAIIPQSLYDEVAQMRHAAYKAPINSQSVNPLAGLLCCGHCGSSMIKSSNGSGRYYFRCRRYASAGGCACQSVRLDLLEKEVLQYISTVYQNLLKAEFSLLNITTEEIHSIIPQLFSRVEVGMFGDQNLEFIPIKLTWKF